MTKLGTSLCSWTSRCRQRVSALGRALLEKHAITLGRAILEVFVITLSAWIPLLLLQWRLTGSLGDWAGYYENILYSGHLIILAISMFGGIMWAAVLSERVVVGIIHKVSIALGILGIVLVVFVFGENPSLNSRLSAEYASVSEAVYWVFVCIQLMLAYVSKRQPRGIGQSLDQGTDNLLGKYQQLETK